LHKVILFLKLGVPCGPGYPLQSFVAGHIGAHAAKRISAAIPDAALKNNTCKKLPFVSSLHLTYGQEQPSVVFT